MAEIIKYVIGVEVSKEELMIRLGSKDITETIKISDPKTYTNKEVGFSSLLKYIRKLVKDNASSFFIMEATGVYYENLAYYLKEAGENVIVVLPNKSKHYRQSLDSKGKSDRIDSKALTLLGLERQFKQWDVPSQMCRQLKELTREYESVINLLTQLKNQLHAKQHSNLVYKNTIESLKQNICYYNAQKAAILSDIDDLIKTAPEVESKVKMIVDSLKGVRLITVAKIIAETDFFSLILNKNQLVSYAGLDVVEDSSGKRYGKTRISSKGNSHIRNALYMPSLSVVKYVDEMRRLYIRLCQKGRDKKVGLTAVMRKLLVLIYTLWKKNVPYDPAFNA
jgi:transposase